MKNQTSLEKGLDFQGKEYIFIYSQNFEEYSKIVKFLEENLKSRFSHTPTYDTKPDPCIYISSDLARFGNCSYNECLKTYRLCKFYSSKEFTSEFIMSLEDIMNDLDTIINKYEQKHHGT